MFRGSRIRVLSIAHAAVTRGESRLRYGPFRDSKSIDLHLLTPQRWQALGRKYEAEAAGDLGVPLLVEKALLTNLPFIQWYGHFYPGLGRVLDRIVPDVIHVWEEPWSIAALQCALIRRENTGLVLEVDQNIFKRLPQPFEAIRRFVLARTDLVLARTASAADVIRKCGFKGPIKEVGYGVDRTTFKAIQKDRPSPDRPLQLGYCGRLVVEKGIDEALDAMALCSDKRIRLSIMGDGPYEPQLRKRVAALGLQGRVSFSGWGSPNEVAAFLQSLDAALLLTRTTDRVREQFGRVIIEAQACGVPVIGSTCGAIPDVMGDGGWVVPERDPRALSELLDRLANHPGAFAAPRLAGLNNVASRFTFEKVAADLAAAWSTAVALKCSKAPDEPSREQVPAGVRQDRRIR